MVIPFSSIIVGDRQRGDKKYGDIDGLAESLRSIGTIQPIVLSRRNGAEGYDLVAGGRRHRAMSVLGTTVLHHGSTLDPSRLGFVFADEVPEDIRKEAELDENLHRLDMDWIDTTLAIASIHRAKKDKDPKWGQRQTALVARVNVRDVNHALRIAKLLRAGDAEMLACRTMMDASSLLAKRAEEAALSEMQRRTKDRLSVGGAASTSSFLDTLNINIGGKKTPAPDLQTPAPTPSGNGPVPLALPVEIPLSRMFMHGDFQNEMPKLPDASFNHIVTDIPYGIDMSNLDEAQVADVATEHNVKDNIALMPHFLREAFRVCKPGGFCVFFYDLDHHEKLQHWAGEAGWRPQRWPFLALKTSACQNNSAQYNTTKNYEVFMLLRKDSQTVLRKPCPTSYRTYDFFIERKLYNNPFAKPFDLWKDIFDLIAFPGQTVLDPFCGEMSSCRAAANCGLVPFGIELVENHYLRGLENMRKVYALIHSSNVSFT